MRENLLASLVGGTLLLCTTASTQTFSNGMQPVTDTDLRVTYCLAVKMELAKDVRDAVNAQPPDVRDDPAMQHLITEADDDVTRLRAYILPRMPTLDSAPLLAAAQRAKGDMVDNDEIGRRECGRPKDAEMTAQDPTVRNKMKACTEGLVTKYPSVARIRRCNDLSWLPF